MLLVVRNTMTAQARLLSGDKAALLLGIESKSVDVAGNMELIHALPEATSLINEHLISMYRQNMAHGTIRSDGTPVTPGKVLVFCETGNERSAAVVAAYCMKLYGLDLLASLQYVQSQRFCVAFDEGLKHLLQTYHDLLIAQNLVKSGSNNSPLQVSTKRGRGQIARDDDEMEIDSDQQDDEARFGSRTAYVPFRDDIDASKTFSQAP